ncbi:hypothetical protein GGR42_002409 [Saonia flava]|uniref:3-keto-alpha-glucoside-1,2-lyase/3-keto-2-hydroxy-glucal hydratase domain-containing protein n=1 Tax=Saonia flava TaxID=523696 RepID=A0A846QXN4_9FLAO|nr:DUF1080 domain-containing protein [Saonia flava]NJB71947.1 hypothetical protein [Saonia flava]
MKNQLFLLFFTLSLFSCKNKKEAVLEKSTYDSAKEEWISLFNGKDLTDWDIKFSNQKLNVNYKNTIRIEDGIFRVVYDEYEEFNDAYGHVYYKEPFSYYKIRFDYRFTGEQTKGGADWNVRNSGVMFHSQSAASNSFGQDFPVSIELQLLGGLSNGEERHTANLCTPGTAFEINGKLNYDHCYDSNSKTYNGDQWVSVEAIVLGNESITHIVEKDTVLVFQKPQIGSGNMMEDLENFGVENKEEWLAKEGAMLHEGYIALQAESHPIDFKNLELLNLCGCKDPKANNYKAYYVKADQSTCTYD